MPARIDLQNDPHAYDVFVTLGGVRYLLYLRWNWRAGDWRVSVQRASDDVWIAAGRRLSPGSMTVDMPDGELHAFGADIYERSALGRSLFLYYYTDAEILTLKDVAEPVESEVVIVEALNV